MPPWPMTRAVLNVMTVAAVESVAAVKSVIAVTAGTCIAREVVALCVVRVARVRTVRRALRVHRDL